MLAAARELPGTGHFIATLARNRFTRLPGAPGQYRVLGAENMFRGSFIKERGGHGAASSLTKTPSSTGIGLGDDLAHSRKDWRRYFSAPK